jgi:predicted lipoprotein with Yx(FWY)xxD motif
MTLRAARTFLTGGAIVAVAALVLAACGSSGGSNANASPNPTTARTPTTKAPTATFRVANSRLGSILVNSQGRTLYMFSADSETTSACTGACATPWPPLTTKGTPTPGTGAKASLVGTIKRTDGTSQVTYNHHPLYTFFKDQKGGDTNGQGVMAFGGRWSVVSPAGNAASAKSSSPAPTTTKPQPAPPAQAATVAIANSSVGNILVNGQGRTVYMFSPDSATTSACSGACATFWPPVTVHGTPTAGSGANASLVGTIKRSDGTTQVTYNHHPLYTFQQDQKAGDTKGQGVQAFGGGWHVLSPAGAQVG